MTSNGQDPGGNELQISVCYFAAFAFGTFWQVEAFSKITTFLVYTLLNKSEAKFLNRTVDEQLYWKFHSINYFDRLKLTKTKILKI